jgi:hypothetical protein
MVTGFTAPQNTAISDEITDKNAVLDADLDTQTSAKAASLTATQAATASEDDMQTTLGRLKSLMDGVGSPAEDYTAVGFDPPDKTRTAVQPQDPTDLVAKALNGRNALDWVGHNGTNRVTYAIEVKIGDTAPFVLIGTSTSQKFIHENTVVGEYYDYRVRAQSARGVVSGWSNEAVCYGMQA